MSRGWGEFQAKEIASEKALKYLTCSRNNKEASVAGSG